MRCSILIVNSQQLMREGLRAILAGECELEVIGDAGDGRTALEIATAEKPEILLIESQLPRLSGIETIRRIREALPKTACIVMSAVHAPAQVREALLAGAAGFVPLDSSAESLLEAIRTVRAGRSYLAPSMADHVVDAIRSPMDPDGAGTGLTSRQREVLQLIAEGLSTKEIADELGISEKTVQTHRAKLMGRTGIRKASSLVRYAIREGIVTA